MTNKIYKYLEPTTEHTDLLLPECDIEDPVYFSNNNPTNGPRSSPGNDSDFNKHDRYVSIFKTMQGDYFSMFSNNMVLPIRTKIGINHKPDFVVKLNLPKYKREHYREGIYIVDNYFLHHTTQVSKEYAYKIIDYYKSVNNIYDGNSEILEYITNGLQPYYKGLGLTNPKFHIRVCTFIPASAFATRDHIYVPSSGVVIGTKGDMNRVAHPESRDYKKYVRSLVSDSKNFIELEINDPNRADDYYIKIGNKVMPITPTMDPSKPKHGCIRTYRNLECLDTQEVELKDLDKLGIFKTIDEADMNGDLTIKTNLLKAQNEKTKLENDAKALALENDKLSLANKELELKVSKLEDEKAMYVDKLEIEKQKLQLEKEKLTNDKEKLKLESKKLEVDNMKLKLENFKLEVEYKLTLHKDVHARENARMELLNKYIDIVTSIAKKNLDIAHLRAKHQADLDMNASKTTTDLLVKGTSIATTLLTKLI